MMGRRFESDPWHFMTDNSNICGAECGDGSPCQHPADSCPVPSHSDPGADNPQGRPFEIGEEDHDDILEAAQLGMSKRGCARAAGVQPPVLERYLDEHPQFRNSFMQARAKGERKLITEGLYNDDADSQQTRFLLSTSFDYIKTERREHTGPDGDSAPLMVIKTDDDE